MFSQFFEKKQSNGHIVEYFKKRKKNSKDPNISSTTIIKCFPRTATSASPRKMELGSRQYNRPPLETQKIGVLTSDRKSNPALRKCIKLEKRNVTGIVARRSQSPTTSKQDFLNFFSKTTTFKPIPKPHGSDKSPPKSFDDNHLTKNISKKVINIIEKEKSIIKSKVATPNRPLSKKASRENSGERRSPKKTVEDPRKLKQKDLEEFMENRKETRAAVFIGYARKNLGEKCLQMITAKEQSKSDMIINAQDKGGWTALHHAAWNENIKLVNILLYNEAEVNITDENGVTPIILAVAKGSYQIAKVLINAKADLRIVDTFGNNIMHYAVAKQKASCVELLLEHGAGLHAKNNDGLSPVDMTDKQFLPTLQALIEKYKRAGGQAESKVSDRKKVSKRDGEENKSTRLESGKSLSRSIQISTISDTIGPKDFKILGVLGNGSFGDVYLAELKATKVIYAMKVLSKANVLKHNLTQYALTEKNVLSFLNHPFIVKLHFAFQTSDYLYMLLDFCPGGDLGEILQKEGKFGEERAKIYICELLLAIEELHKRNIIYRDLKPDNVVLDKEGHAILTDFGLSKEEVDGHFNGAKSFCGSVAYLAPEMLKRAGHGKAVDWYLLGVLLFEMLTGLPPFYADSKEELFKNIESAVLQVPSHVGPEARSLIKKLLERDPCRRLGSGPGEAADIKAHAFFSGINWFDVYQRKLVPPKPKLKIRLSQKNIPKNLQPDEKHVEHPIEGWTFIDSEYLESQSKC